MKKRILSILLLCCMVLTMLPTAAFAAGGAVRPAATQYTYTLHYDANGGSGAPPSQSVTSSEFHVWVPISEIIPTRDGYTFMGWANSRTGRPIYGGNGGYTSCLVVHGYDMSTTIYAIWEVHNHSWGEWTSNGNGTHTRTCATDSSHTETGSCSGGKATGTEKAICETCHTAYGELLQLTKTAITTPPTLPSEGYVGDQYFDGDLEDGEAKVEGTDIVVPGSFRFKHNWGGVVGPGENHMEILFTPDDAETYATAECIVTVTGLKHTITGVIEEVLPGVPLGTAFEYLGLPFGVDVITNTGATFYVPVTWDGSSYDPNARGEQIITGHLDVEWSIYEEELEPTSTVKAIARITLIGDGGIVPTLKPPTYSRQIYSGDFCQLAFSDEYLSGGTATTADDETVDGRFTLNEEQEKYGYWNRGGGLVQVGPLALQVTFTPYDRMRFSTAECTVNVDVIPRKFRQANTSYIDNKKIGTAFEDLGLPNAFYFFAEADEPNHEGSGLNANVPGIIKWDGSNYDPNSYEEQTIYGEVNRAEFEKYYIVPEGADLRGVVKVTLQADPVDTEIAQPPVFRWKNGDFTLPDNTMFVNRIFEMGATGGESANLADGVARVKGTDTVVPGTFSFQEGAPAITTMTLPGGAVGTPYHHQLHANGGGFILWELFSGELPDGLTLKQTTGEISGTPTAVGTATFTVKATNSVGNDKKELSITIAKAPAAEHTITVTTEGGGTASASHAKAAAGTEITLIATPGGDYHFKEWQVISGGVAIANNKFTMPDSNVEIKAIFEEDAPSAEELVDPVIRIHLSPWGDGYYAVPNGTWTAADFFQPGKAPKGAKITAVTPPTSPSIPVRVNVDSDGTLSCTKTQETTIPEFKSETYTVTITSDDYAPISAPLTVRQYLDADFRGPIYFNAKLLYGDTYTYTCRVNNPGENGVWSALIQDPEIFEIYQETTDITSEPGKSIYTVQIRAIKASARVTWIDFLYFSDTTMASTKDSGSAFTGGAVSTRPLTVTAGSATITEGDALPTDLVTCTGLLDSEGRTDDRDTVLDNALSYRLLNANNEEITAEAARNTPGTYTVVPTAELKPGWDERYSLNRVNGTLTVDDKVEELFTVTVKTDGNGTASANPPTAEALTEITLTATPNRGYHFKEWQVLSPAGLVITNNKFLMPNGDVEIKAIFEKNTSTGGGTGTGATTYPITVNSKNGDVTASHKTASKGTTVILTVDPDKGYVLDTLTVLDGKDKERKLTDKGDGKYSFIMPADKVTVEANFKEEFPDLPNPFSDLAPSDFCYDAVMWAVGRDITGGIGNYTFGPNLPCTRAQAVTFLWRAAGSPEPETRAMPFTDVPVGSYYYNAVLWAIENGITEGTSDTMFSPDATCSRAQIVTFLWRAGGSPAASGNSAFTDVASDAYYAAAVIWAEKNDITGGIGGGLFGSNNDCTRGQIVTFLYRSVK